MIVGGRGFGQVRTVADNSKSRVTLTEPWRIAPDADSWIVVRQFAYQNVLLNNLCRDTLQGIQMSGAVDNVVDRFVGLRSGFGVWFPAFNGPKGERLYYSPSALNEIRNCIFTDTPNAVVFSADRELAVLRQPFPLTFGNMVRGNQFIHGDVQSHGGVVANSSWLAPDDARRQDCAAACRLQRLRRQFVRPVGGQAGLQLRQSDLRLAVLAEQGGGAARGRPGPGCRLSSFPEPLVRGSA